MNPSPGLTAEFRECRLCPRNCGVDRRGGGRGWCGGGDLAEVASVTVHTGEEPFLTRGHGVGNVFFSRCNMACVYCQNHQISGDSRGRPMTSGELAESLLHLQSQGCPTVGLVSPTHYLPAIRTALAIARKSGLTAPVIYNSNGYESLHALQTLEGLVDIYLPDLKYADDQCAVEYSRAPGYVKASRAAVIEMYRQVGNLNGSGLRGLCVRHLVLPNRISGTGRTLEFLAGISKDITVSLMSQYNPLHRAGQYPLISRRLSPREYWKAVEQAEELGLHNTLIQEPETSPDSHLPDFERENPFSL